MNSRMKARPRNERSTLLAPTKLPLTRANTVVIELEIVELRMSIPPSRRPMWRELRDLEKSKLLGRSQVEANEPLV
jgi:hypothetical protein